MKRRALTIAVTGGPAGGAVPAGEVVLTGDAVLRTQAVELGSATKALTGIVLAGLDRDGLLPLGTRVHEVLGLGRPLLAEGAAVTVEDLATHHGGLPRLGAMDRVDLADPYRGLGADAVLDQLERAAASPGPRRYAYSNLGYAALGLCIGRVAGSWAAALRDRVLHPLGVDGVWAGPPPPGVPRATGRDRWGRRVTWWTMNGYAAAGACTGTGQGVAALLDALLAGPDRAPAVGAALDDALRPRRPLPGGHIGLGWHIAASGHAWHDGATGGFSSFLGLDPARTRAVARLAVGPSRPAAVRRVAASLRDAPSAR